VGARLARVYGNNSAPCRREVCRDGQCRSIAKLSSLEHVECRNYTFPETGEKMPFALLVPRSYRAGRRRPAPLLLALHGFGYDYQWCFELPGLVEWAQQHGVVVVAPRGYRRDGWYGCPDLAEGGETSEKTHRSEADVQNVIKLVMAELDIDVDKVFAFGWSMGGGGALRMALRKPRLFAALLLVAPAIGAPHLGIPSWTQSEDVKLEDLSKVAILVVQGTLDRPVPVVSTRQLCSDLDRAGARHAYIEVQGGSHSCAELLPPVMLRRTLSCLVSHTRQRAGATETAKTQEQDLADELHISGNRKLITQLLAVRA